jgi:hypothetical protein
MAVVLWLAALVPWAFSMHREEHAPCLRLFRVGRNYFFEANLALRNLRSQMASLLPDLLTGARYLANVRVTLRDGFFVGLSIALLCGLFLIWIWQPERQVRRHSQKLFHQVEAKNWSALSDLIGSDYSDQWNHDRTNLIERMREVMRYLRGMRIIVTGTGNQDRQSKRCLDGKDYD